MVLLISDWMAVGALNLNVQNTDGHKALHRKLNYLRIAGVSLGCFVGMSVIGYLSILSGSDLIIPSFAASCAIGMTIPDSAFAQPRNVIGGHLFSGLTGLLCSLFFGTSWWSLAIAVGLATGIMMVTRTLHPPAASDPILFMMQGIIHPYIFLTVLLIGSIVLVTFFDFYHRGVTHRKYPKKSYN